MEKTAKTSKPQRVRVVSASFEKVWYKKLIGKEFIIDSKTTRDFYVTYNGYTRGILCIDGVIVN